MVSTPAASRCQSQAERRYIPSGMCSYQNDMGEPWIRFSIPSSPAYAASESPNGPAPMVSSLVCSCGMVPLPIPPYMSKVWQRIGAS
jgi:hypothetical protein